MRPYTGEPIALAGKRMMFTTWLHVRPTQFYWHDRDGKPLPQMEDNPIGPWDATYRATEDPHGIRMVMLPAQRVGPVITEKQPWEARGISLSTIIQSEGKYRSWAYCQSAEGDRYFCYLESADGFHWERPELGQVEYNGSRANNLLRRPGPRFEDHYGQSFWGMTVFQDPSGPPEERYKAVHDNRITHEELAEYAKRWPEDWEPRARWSGHVHCLVGAVSPDGINWTQLPDPLSVEHSDTQPVAYYDQQLGKYVIITRNQMVTPMAPGWKAEGKGRMSSWWAIHRRAIGRTESEDFRHFPVSQVIIDSSPEMEVSDVFYANAKTTIPGAPDHHIMFPTIWHQHDDTTTVTVATTNDTRAWHLHHNHTVLDTASCGEWDGGCIFAHPSLLELPDGSFALPYTGYAFTHKYPRGQWSFAPGYAVWPKGRLIGIEARERGAFSTVAVVPPGRKLRMNAVTKRAGSIQVQVAGLDGNTISGRAFEDCTPIVGDALWSPVLWRGQDDLGLPDGEPVILRFRLDKAQVFGVQFE